MQRLGVRARGCGDVADAVVIAEVARLVADGELEIPIAGTYPLDQVGRAFAELAERHTHGKIVLLP